MCSSVLSGSFVQLTVSFLFAENEVLRMIQRLIYIVMKRVKKARAEERRTPEDIIHPKDRVLDDKSFAHATRVVRVSGTAIVSPPAVGPRKFLA